MNNDEGIRQLGRNLFAVRVKRIDARNGRQRNRKMTVRGTKADARRARDRIRAELASTATARPPIRLGEFAARWIELRAARLAPSTLRRYRYSLEHVVPALGDLFVHAIAPSDIAEYVARRIRAGAEGYTVLNELRMLRTMARDSVTDGYATRNWCERVPPPKVSHYTRKNPNLLTPEQFAAVINHISDRWRALVLFMTTTGLRWGEASALRWQDVEGERAEITHVNDRGRSKKTTKTGDDRSVPVLPEVFALLGKRKSSGLVFPSRAGKLHRGYPLIKVLTAACRLADVTRVTPHGLRRTFVNLARQLTSREVLKSISGHSTDVMVGHYSFVGDDEKMRAAKALGGVLQVSSTTKRALAN